MSTTPKDQDTKPAYTEGPWTVSQWHEPRGGVSPCVVAGPATIARVHVAPITNGQHAANAHLIAAAPDYDAAAREMIARHDADARAANFTQCGCENCKPFRAIVAKAEGRS